MGGSNNMSSNSMGMLQNLMASFQQRQASNPALQRTPAPQARVNAPMFTTPTPAQPSPTQFSGDRSATGQVNVPRFPQTPSTRGMFVPPTPQEVDDDRRFMASQFPNLGG